MSVQRIVGRLPPEVVGRVVRRSLNRVRLCYAGGLTRHRGLEGRTEVRFVVGRDGAITWVSNAAPP